MLPLEDGRKLTPGSSCRSGLPSPPSPPRGNTSSFVPPLGHLLPISVAQADSHFTAFIVRYRQRAR